jgi:hypothetical protein
VPDLQQVIDRLRQIQSLPRQPVPEELEEAADRLKRLAVSLL